jgi:hypothetical protein
MITVTPWPESASELYRPSDRHLTVKLVPTLADRGCCVVSVTDPHRRNIGFLDRSHYCFFQILNCTHETEWAPFQTHYFSESLVASKIEPGTSGSVASNPDHYTIEVKITVAEKANRSLQKC